MLHAAVMTLLLCVVYPEKACPISQSADNVAAFLICSIRSSNNMSGRRSLAVAEEPS